MADARAFTVARIDARDAATAARIHAVQQAAYRQEAALLGVTHFPPLDRTVADIAASSDLWFAAFADDELAGAISLEPLGGGEALIASLTVLPSAQRRGMGRALVEHVVACIEYPRFLVSTGAANAPALALYRRLGFTEVRRRAVGAEPIDLVELALVSRPARAAR